MRHSLIALAARDILLDAVTYMVSTLRVSAWKAMERG
jgi:hypothetical protein